MLSKKFPAGNYDAKLGYSPDFLYQGDILLSWASPVLKSHPDQGKTKIKPFFEIGTVIDP